MSSHADCTYSIYWWMTRSSFCKAESRVFTVDPTMTIGFLHDSIIFPQVPLRGIGQTPSPSWLFSSVRKWRGLSTKGTQAKEMSFSMKHRSRLTRQAWHVCYLYRSSLITRPPSSAGVIGSATAGGAEGSGVNGRPHVGTVHLNPAESADGSSMDEWGRLKNLSPKCQLE